MANENRPVTPHDFARWKSEGRKISVLTAYDHSMARLLDEAGIDCLLVGDSLGMVVQGHETTLPVTLAQMLYHTEMVARGARRALVVGDLPYGSYHVSEAQAVRSAIRLLSRTGCGAVKLEGGRRMAERLRAIVRAEVPVMAHIGMTPQSVKRFGGFKVQRDAEALLDDARAVAEAGAFAVVLECIPADLAARITEAIPIASIGIGAGGRCDGQVLVFHDMLGLYPGHTPKFVRRYAALGEAIREAAAGYAGDVREGRFPGESESFR
ncbi:MAG: 3-methyl-2-oxobutanoate hydroxymethyltransferase [Isosphaeraceae bacterium]